jgi:uncharacterized protein YecE (DUF72 family)
VARRTPTQSRTRRCANGYDTAGHQATRSQWADRIAAWQRQRRSVLVYFDNDQKAAAPKDAQRLIDLLRE